MHQILNVSSAPEGAVAFGTTTLISTGRRDAPEVGYEIAQYVGRRRFGRGDTGQAGEARMVGGASGDGAPNGISDLEGERCADASVVGGVEQLQVVDIVSPSELML